MNFDQTSPKNRNPQQKKISHNATKKTAQFIVRENRPTGNTDIWHLRSRVATHLLRKKAKPCPKTSQTG